MSGMGRIFQCSVYFVLSVWEERKVFGYMAKLQRSPVSFSERLWGYEGCRRKLEAGTSHMFGGSTHSSGCMVNGYGYRLSIINPRRACAARVTVVVLCVCVSVSRPLIRYSRNYKTK